MTKSILRFVATTLPILALALTPSAARAQVYTGSWPFVVTQQEAPFTGQTTTYCITLTESSCSGRTHCGSAAILPGNPQLGIHEKAYGSFQVIGQLITVTIAVPGTEAESWIFVAPTSSTSFIGTGLFNAVQGESFDTGVLTVGAKHGCVPGT